MTPIVPLTSSKIALDLLAPSKHAKIPSALGHLRFSSYLLPPIVLWQHTVPLPIFRRSRYISAFVRDLVLAFVLRLLLLLLI